MKRILIYMTVALMLWQPCVSASAAQPSDPAGVLGEPSEGIGESSDTVEPSNGTAEFSASAEPTETAWELTIKASVEGAAKKNLTDKSETTYTKISADASVVITCEQEISSLYIIFDRIFGNWTLSDGVTQVVCGENDFLHEYVDVAGLFGYSPTTLTLTFPERECSLSEIHAFGEGRVPDWVQQWQPPCEEADLLLTSTHIDDEQLFFAGILPYYAGECGLAVQVVYFTDPFTYHDRQHEQLNGLWTVGVRNYPISGQFKDAYSKTSKDAYAHQENYGFSRDDMVLFQVEMIRRFRPHVVVGHDINGEYGHGQHMINCETLMDALDLAADDTYDPDSILAYGTWDTPKAYIHLWEENPIVMDWDIPLETFGGKTAFQVSQEGFLCHESQQWTWFRGWIFGKNKEITKASEIKTYSPCRYGLYRTTVGLDEAGGDMFENIPMSYAEIREEELRQQQEELRRQQEEQEEAERKAREAAELAEKEKEQADAAASGQTEPGEGKPAGEGLTDSRDSYQTESTDGESAVGIAIILTITILCGAAVIYIALKTRRKAKGRRKRF